MTLLELRRFTYLSVDLLPRRELYLLLGALHMSHLVLTSQLIKETVRNSAPLPPGHTQHNAHEIGTLGWRA